MLRLAWETDKWLTIAYYLTAAIGALMPLGVSLATRYLIDQLTQGQSGNLVVIPVVVFLLLMRYVTPFIENLTWWGINNSYLDFLFRYKLQNYINFCYYKKLTELDVAYFENPETQNLIAKTRDTMTWRLPDMLRQFSYTFRALVMAVSAFGVLLAYGWWVPLVIAIFSLPRLFAQFRFGNVQWSIYGSGAPEAKKLWYFMWILAEPTVLKEVKIFQSSQYLLARFKKIQKYLYELNKKPLDDYLKVLTILPVLETVVVFILAYYKLPLVLGGLMTVGTFALFMDMILYLQNGVVNTAVHLGEVYGNNLYVNDFFEVLNLPAVIKEAKKATRITADKSPRIEFRDVSFSYPNSKKMVLKKVNFVIEPGENIALVGANGAGKSTIVKLLCRFYDVTEGEILINGVNIKDMNRESLYGLLGTLFQEFWHYHFTVKENILMGSPYWEDKKLLEKAAKDSEAIEFINKLPKKFDQVLGKEYDEGEEISGGEWQKLALARAFYEQALVLILDEPTSAIDAISEYEIFTNLQKVYKKKTLVLVSHRFSTVRNANKIFVIDNGEVIEQGSHKELLEKKGQYAKMFKLQAKGYKEE